MNLDKGNQQHQQHQHINNNTQQPQQYINSNASKSQQQQITFV